jgi:hypothetical protein
MRLKDASAPKNDSLLLPVACAWAAHGLRTRAVFGLLHVLGTGGAGGEGRG